MKLAFVDTETTGLLPHRHHIWEIAVIIRANGRDHELLWQLRPDLATADPDALKIGRYHERFALPEGELAAEMPTGSEKWDRPNPLPLRTVLFDIADALRGSVVIGSNPAFDASFLGGLFRAHDIPTEWHYRAIDIATLAAGYMWALEPELMAKDEKPFSSRWLSHQVGVEPPRDDVAHTALGDARWARDVFDAITAVA